MDANRFDALAKNLTGTRSRRSAIGSVVAGSFLGALGLGRSESARVAAQGGGLCVVDFHAIVRQGPSASRTLAPGAPPGALRGFLRFTLSETGNLEDADLLLTDGTSLPVVGQAAGHGIQARIDLGQGRALVAVGVGEQEVARCLGRIDGTATSTEIGDLGEWHGLAGVQNVPAGAAQPRGSGNRPASGSSGSGRGSSGSAGAMGQQNAGSRPGNGSPADGDSANSDVALACPDGQTRCDGACVNLDRDPLNCGRCGSACSPGLNCFIGECSDRVEPCLMGQTRCGDICVTTTTDVFNCGECGRICALEEECTGGQCLLIDDNDDSNDQVACPDGQTRCNETCTDLQADEANCGACGTACAAAEECVAGKCATPAPVLCPEGQVRCDGVCKDALPNFGTEGLSCPGGGAAPTECPAGRELCNGACFPAGTCQPAECQPGWGYCYGLCRDFQNDPGYCGGCTTGCMGGAYCREGKCFTCSQEFTPCGDTCVDTQTDLNNCGACGNRCGTQCIDGRCTGVGPSPVQTCAKTGERCAPDRDAPVDRPCCAGHICVAGTCYAERGTGDYPCGREFGSPNDCGGFCVYLLTDPNFCGDCGTRCPTGSVCRNGSCSFPSAVASDGQTLAPTDTDPEAEPGTTEPEPEPEPELTAPTCPEGQTDCGGSVPISASTSPTVGVAALFAGQTASVSAVSACRMRHLRPCRKRKLPRKRPRRRLPRNLLWSRRQRALRLAEHAIKPRLAGAAAAPVTRMAPARDPLSGPEEAT